MSENIQTAFSSEPLIEEIYHIYSQGKNTPFLVKDTDGFIFIMNKIAVLSLLYEVKLLAFSVMDTHLHIIMNGSSEECGRYIKALARAIITELSDDARILTTKLINFQMSRLKDRYDVKEKICYVLLNPIETDPFHIVSDYRWSSNGIYMRKPERFISDGRPIGCMSVRKQRVMFRCRTRLPETWRIDEDGMILPFCYVDYMFVNKLFYTARTFYYFMNINKKKESMLKLEEVGSRIAFYSDNELKERAMTIAKRLYGKSLKTVDMVGRAAIAQELRKEYFSSPGQISRVLQLPEDLIVEII